VRFSEPDRTADDDVIDLSRELPPPVVVISNDRAVREGSEAGGALALWSSALVAWSSRR
jgi:hypothetical protein